MTRDQFADWINMHRQRHPFARLPEFDRGQVMYDDWRTDLSDARVLDSAVLEAASGRMVREPAPSDKRHFATLLQYAREAVARIGGRQQHDLSSREGAAAASANCERCGGSGLAVVWHPRPDYEAKIPETVSAYCVCALGMFIAANHERKHAEVFKRTPKLRDVLEGRSVWLVEPPGFVLGSRGPLRSVVKVRGGVGNIGLGGRPEDGLEDL